MKVQEPGTIGVQGMNNGLIPIIAYNYGAGKEKRIHETIRCAISLCSDNHDSGPDFS